MTSLVTTWVPAAEDLRDLVEEGLGISLRISSRIFLDPPRNVEAGLSEGPTFGTISRYPSKRPPLGWRPRLRSQGRRLVPRVKAAAPDRQPRSWSVPRARGRGRSVFSRASSPWRGPVPNATARATWSRIPAAHAMEGRGFKRSGRSASRYLQALKRDPGFA